MGFPSGDELSALLPPGLASKIPDWCRNDLSDRLNRHCRRYVTGGKFYAIVCSALLCMMIITLVVLPLAKHDKDPKGDGDPSKLSYISLLFYPGLQVAIVIPLLLYTLWAQCVRNPGVDSDIRAECEAFSEESHGVYLVQFTTFNASM